MELGHLAERCPLSRVWWPLYGYLFIAQRASLEYRTDAILLAP